jgi:arylsulfatase A-like enzyme
MFTNARSSVPLTLPSFTSIFTSTYPVYHKVRQNETYSISDSVTTLVEVFKEDGFRTKAVIGSTVLASRYGLDQGFDQYDDEFGDVPLPSESMTMQPMEYGPVVKRNAQEVVRLAVDWLEENSDEPFFLFLHFFDPHIPLDSPRKLPTEGYQPEEITTWAYDSEVAVVDRQLGVLMRSLEMLGIKEKTLIVFTSDHGEGLLEHMEATHGYLLYDSTIRVPMIFSCPGILPQGKVLDETVRTIDLMPTLIDLFDLEPPETLQGISFKEQILGDSPPPTVDSYFETYYGRFFMGWSELKGVQWNEWKYIQAPKPELYNLRDDPKELVNLIEERPDVASLMKERLSNLISTYSNPSVTMAQSLTMDEEYREILESLGYFTELVEVAEPETLLPDPKDMMADFTRKQIDLSRIRTACSLIHGGRYDDGIQFLDGIEDAGDRQWMVHLHYALAYIGKSEFQRAEEELQAASDLTHDSSGQDQVRQVREYLEQSQ